ncbi:MAG: 4-(cytidine 5'-diphospho)-2-C-methyl-D-erythritol kinase [Planctomycetes bacterium]|nr:4-(cytidine 5'-diphospho)-2-C-methyl-D-erythritol kinase [Planctomycetota bacterium]
MMRPRWEAGCLVVRTPAKINLYLEVLGKRADGFHELDMLNQAVDLFDTIRFAPRPDADEIVIHCDDPGIPTDGRNLVAKAWGLLRDRTEAPGVEVWIEKRIPAGAGLAGGSADAAGALVALRTLWELDLSGEELQALAEAMGSDVPFFLRGGRAVCRGRGERVIPVADEPPLWFVIHWPGFSISTREVFEAFEMPLTGPRALLSICSQELVARVRDGSAFFNRLEDGVFARWRRLEGLRRALVVDGCLSARMSGSGSALYAAFLSRDAGDELARVVRERGAGSAFLARGLPGWRVDRFGKERSGGDH